jgi:segregation and condensation protein A
MSALPAISVLPDRNEAVPRETAEKVLQYLVFHRSLLGGEGEGERSSQLLERYMDLVQNLTEGVHVVIDDPFQKATALLFELVLEKEFDPWEIDLARFTHAYLNRVREDGTINFAIAGRLVGMAWSILYMQSERVLRSRDTPSACEGALSPDTQVDSGPVEECYLDSLETPEAVDVTTSVLSSTDPPPLLEMVRHPESRPVSLLELVRAFGEAEEDARRAIRVQELRERLREEQRASPEILVHGDIPERDVEEAWAIARRHAVGEAFPLLDLWNRNLGVDRFVAMFLALLYLAREHAIELSQEVLCETPVLVTRIVEQRPAIGPEA